MDHNDFVFPPGIYKRHEIPVADYLMSFQDALREDFMKGFSTLEEAIKAQGMDNLDRRAYGVPLEKTAKGIVRKNDEGNFQPDVTAWKGVNFRYELHNDEADISLTMDSEFETRYPTAFKLIKEYGDKCPIANYSCLAPNTVLHRHTGIENRDGKYIRIHIPLIIPPGDVFLEVNGEESTWDDLFGLNNQMVHSAHNYTNEYRLIFMIDLEREFIGMPKGEPYDPRLEKFARPHIRKGKHE